MKSALILLAVACCAIASAIESEPKTEGARDKRHFLISPPISPSFVYVPNVNTVPIVLANPPVVPVDPQPANCGAAAFTCQGACLSNAVGGIPSVKGEYPWLVQLYSEGRGFFCGGSLINKNYILTSASCIEPASPASVAALRVHLGDFELHTVRDGNTHVERNVSVIYRHTDFVMGNTRTPTVHDIALLKLAEPVTFNNYIQPICLDDGAYRVDNGLVEGVLAGYSSLSGLKSNTLNKVNVRVTSPQECSSIYSPLGIKITENHICAGVPDLKTSVVNVVDPCVEDLGGPLYVKLGPNYYRQVGVTSYGTKCGGPAPIHTRVSRYRTWIDQVITQVNPKIVAYSAEEAAVPVPTDY